MGGNLAIYFYYFLPSSHVWGYSFTKIVKLPNNGHFVMLFETTRGYCD